MSPSRADRGTKRPAYLSTEVMWISDSEEGDTRSSRTNSPRQSPVKKRPRGDDSVSQSSLLGATRTPLVKKTYGKAGGGAARQISPADHAERASSVEIPLINVVRAGQEDRKTETACAIVTDEEKENTPHLSESSAPNSPASTTSAELSTGLTPPLARPFNLIDISKARTVGQRPLPSPTTHYADGREGAYLAELTKIAVRDSWSRRKAEARPGKRIFGAGGKAEAFTHRGGKVQTIPPRPAKEQAEPACLTVKVVVRDDPAASISLLSSASLTPLSPSVMLRNAHSTSFTYLIRPGLQQDILTVRLLSYIVPVPAEIVAPAPEREGGHLKGWRLEVRDGYSRWQAI